MTPPSEKANRERGSKPFSLKRQAGNRPIKMRILIVGEGQQTEPNYFRYLKEEHVVRERYAITVKGAHGISQDAVVKETIEFKRRGDYDEVWCILDVEGPSKADNLTAAYELADKNNISLWLSNPSIEVWFLLHLVKQGRPYLDGDSAEKELKKHWSAHFRQDYNKADDGIYMRLRKFIGSAVANAEWVLETHHQATSSRACNSSTDLYRLISRLMPDGLPGNEPDRLKNGAIAPDFKLGDQNGDLVQMSSLRGKTVVLFFHPTIKERASIAEVSSFQSANNNIDRGKVVILGVSPDSITILQESIVKDSLSFLLSDVDHIVGKAYGIWNENTTNGKVHPTMERVTFVIDPAGVLVHTFRDVDVQQHADQVLRLLIEKNLLSKG